MYVFFKDIEEANGFEQSNPNWEPVTFSPGYVTGSVIVMYRERGPVTQFVEDMAKSVYPSGKRRGRPPKVRPLIRPTV